MDSNINNVDNNKYYFIAFLAFIIISVIIVVVIIFIVPKSQVALFGECTDQIDCENGLICSKSSPTGGKCLGGLNYPCSNNSDCNNQYLCLDNSFTNTKVCMFPPPQSKINVAPVISLELPTQQTQGNTVTYTLPTQSNNVTYNPQAILNSILPATSAYQSNMNHNSGISGNREYRTFTPFSGITKKKL